MNYDKIFQERLEKLKQEGNYRVFADLERYKGSFPRAKNYIGDKERDVTVWGSNDYLGMGQNKDVIAAMSEALEKCGAGAGAEQEISQGQIIITSCLNRNWQTYMEKTQLCFLLPVMSLTGHHFRS